MPIDEIRYKSYRRIFKKVALEAESEYFKHKFDSRVISVKKNVS